MTEPPRGGNAEPGPRAAVVQTARGAETSIAEGRYGEAEELLRNALHSRSSAQAPAS